MASDRLTKFPVSFTAGTNFRLDLTFSDNLASEGGSIAVYLNGPQQIDTDQFTYSTDGDAFTVDVLPAVTTLWKVGVYKYTVKSIDSDSVEEIGSTGRIEILADPINETNIEARSHAELMVAGYKELLEDLKQNPYSQILHGNKQYTLQDMPEIKKLLNEYEHEVYGEQQAERQKNGEEVQSDLAFQFTD